MDSGNFEYRNFYIINSKDKNAECGVGNTKKNSTSQIKKKHHYLQVFIIIFKGQLRERQRDKEGEAERGKGRV